ncbi:hypothetical protein V502_01047 [Pseudogymnoascus sp. VKM F-4520 (FW-2644)]|nr:hypothetical protein V502_01047 [Pseudogymnoascus sp. VKM F-4520 (FW-2644)]
MASSALPSLAPSFVAKKSAILHDLLTPASSYEDASPKGSVDIAIVELIDGINKLDGFVTTSSCAGRISVFVEGKKKSEDRQVDEDLANDVEGRGQSSQDKETIAGTGGKGGGGKWLYVSHDPFTFEDGQDLAAALGMARKGDEESAWEGQRLVRFKFEPLILHILTASLEHAQAVLRAGLAAGFRESGAINLTSPSSATPMVAIRSMGLGLESMVGVLDSNDEATCFVSEKSLRGLLTISNERFEENSRRKERFWKALVEGIQAGSSGDGLKKKRGEDGGDWEDKEVRRERLRREGLERSKAKKESTNTEPT